VLVLRSVRFILACLSDEIQMKNADKSKLVQQLVRDAYTAFPVAKKTTKGALCVCCSSRALPRSLILQSSVRAGKIAGDIDAMAGAAEVRPCSLDSSVFGVGWLSE
jgi:hypothetical protein